MNVKFSVIVPVHNGEKYIDELVSSILEQSKEGIEEPEIILVENGSDDVSPAICDRYADEYENIKVLHFGRIGAYNARREGMRAATGDYLVFADADDAVAESLLKELTDYVSFFRCSSLACITPLDMGRALKDYLEDLTISQFIYKSEDRTLLYI